MAKVQFYRDHLSRKQEAVDEAATGLDNLTWREQDLLMSGKYQPAFHLQVSGHDKKDLWLDQYRLTYRS